MPHRLYAARYTGATYGSLNPTETFEDLAEVKIRWSLPGGIQRAEISVRATSSLDGYRRYRNHLGMRFALFDNYVNKYIGLQCFEVIPDGRHVTYVCSGVWKRAHDDLYHLVDMGDLTLPTDDTDVAIKDILDDSVSITNSDQTNIAGSGVNTGGWAPLGGEITAQKGTIAAKAIAELALSGDSSDNPMDFYFVPTPFNVVQMDEPYPYLKARSTTASPDWIFAKEDLAPNGLTLARHLWDLKTNIRIGFGRLYGTHDGGNGEDQLIDSAASFLVYGVAPGDRVMNIQAQELFTVQTVTDANTLTFTEHAAGTWNNGNDYSVRLKNTQWTDENATTATDWWAVQYREEHREMDLAQASQYRDQLYEEFNDAILQQAFVIGAPTIRNSVGARLPLWRPLMGDSFYFRGDDIFPEAALLDESDNRKQTFMVGAMDYTYSNNRLRLVPANAGDSRLDVLLEQADLINGQLISTEAAWRAAKRKEREEERRNAE